MAGSIENPDIGEYPAAELQTSERFLKLLDDLTRAALETPDCRTMLQNLANHLAELFRADSAYITIWDEGDQLPIPGAASGSSRDLYPTLSAKPGTKTITGAVLQTGQALILDDITTTPFAAAKVLKESLDRSVLALPLIAGDQKLGAIIIAFHTRREFSADEIVRGEHAAKQVALAVANARLLETEREQRLLAETLQEVTLTFASQTNPATVLDEILQQAQRLVPFKTSSITLLEGDTLRVVRSRGYQEIGSAAFVSSLVQQLTDLPLDLKVVQSRQPLVIDDVRQEPRWVTLDETAWIRSVLVVPIWWADRVLGLLRFDSQVPGTFAEVDAKRLQPLANAAAIALENARLIETERRRSAELEALRQASLSVTASLELNAVLNAILEYARMLMAADGAHIFLYDGRQLTFKAAHRRESEKLEEHADPSPGGLTESVARSGKQLVIGDIHDHPVFHNWPWGRAVTSYPLQIGDQVLGVMNIAFEQPHAFAVDELRLLELLADQAAIAIQNARLHDQVQRHATELERRVAERTAQLEQYSRRQAALAEFGLAINLPDELPAALERAAEMTQKLLASSGGAAVILWNAVTHRLETEAATFGGEELALIERWLQANDGGASLIVQEQRPLIVTNVAEDPFDNGSMPTEGNLQAYVAVPLLAENELLGILVAADGKPTGYTQDDVEVMVALANRIAVVITKVRLYEEVAKAKEAAETASRAKSEFLANMSHELRTPLSSILGFSEVLSEQAFGELNAKQQRHVENILLSSRRLLQLINDLLDLAKIEAGRMEVDALPFDLGSMIYTVRKAVAAQAENKDQSLDIKIDDSLPAITADPKKLRKILLNLMSNAVKYTPEGGQITITATVDEMTGVGGLSQTASSNAGPARRPAQGDETPAAPYLCVSVADTGIGLTAEEESRIFGVFEQVDGSYRRRQPGTGLGLALTRRLVELHGGQIWVSSEGRGHGSVFSFAIPLRGPGQPEAVGPT
jgi:signal transduction histidine kinase